MKFELLIFDMQWEVTRHLTEHDRQVLRMTCKLLKARFKPGKLSYNQACFHECFMHYVNYDKWAIACAKTNNVDGLESMNFLVYLQGVDLWLPAIQYANLDIMRYLVRNNVPTHDGLFSKNDMQMFPCVPQYDHYFCARHLMMQCNERAFKCLKWLVKMGWITKNSLDHISRNADRRIQVFLDNHSEVFNALMKQAASGNYF